MLVLLMVHCGHTLFPPHVELQRRNHHKSHGEVPSQHPCGEASHSHRPTAASRCRWHQGHSRLFSPAVPMALGVALARLGGRCAMQPHCNACGQNSQDTPPS
ncbi:hypothetical protein TcCL_NonESM11317 [Trypanosoma cruzi]|nr:hypothetical protein TcCL_NonESM11317 [Trypanosoma cruzi]